MDFLVTALLTTRLCAVDDEGEVVADVALHVLDALAQLDVLVVPGDRARRQRDDPAREPRRVALDRQRRDGLDHEPIGLKCWCTMAGILYTHLTL